MTGTKGQSVIATKDIFKEPIVMKHSISQLHKEEMMERTLN